MLYAHGRNLEMGTQMYGQAFEHWSHLSDLKRLVSLNLASLVKYVHLSIYCPASMAAASCKNQQLMFLRLLLEFQD